MKDELELQVATNHEIKQLEKLSTENLIIWIIGKGQEKELMLSSEEIVI